MIRIVALALVLSAAAASPALADCKVRVQASLSSSSEHSGPTVPCTANEVAKKAAAHQRPPKVVDPMKLIRNRMIDGKKVSHEEMQQLADSGDDLAQFYLAKRIEAAEDPETLDAAARYYRRAAENGRKSAVRPLIRLLNAGVFEEQPKNLASSQELLEKLAGKGDAVARDGLIAMYRIGKPFGLDPARADELLVASAEGGDSKAALDLAFALLTGVPEPDEVEQAKGYLEIAALSETLNVRTMAENLLRTLEPELTASTETVQ